MTKARPVVMYLEQVRVYGEPISVTRSEVLFAKSDGTTVMPHNRVLTKADNKTMGESFLNELIYVLGAQEGDERHIPSDREILVYTSNEKDSDNYRCYLNAINTGISYPVHNFKLCQRLRRLRSLRKHRIRRMKMVQKWRAMKCESADGDSTVPYLFVVQLQGDERQALFDRYYCNGKDLPPS